MHSHEVSAPAFIATALKLKVSPSAVTDQDETCSLCGVHLPEGTPCAPWYDNGTFMDWSAIASNGRFICLPCRALWSRIGMQKLTKAVVTQDGAWPIGRFAALSWFLLNPPEPPFAFGYAPTSNQYHLWWRALLNWSKDDFCVQHGANRLWIHHQNVLDGIEDVRAFREANGIENKRLPFDIDFDHPEQSTGAFAHPPAGTTWVWPSGLRERLARLSCGDRWAVGVCSILKELPARPDPFPSFSSPNS